MHERLSVGGVFSNLRTGRPSYQGISIWQEGYRSTRLLQHVVVQCEGLSVTTHKFHRHRRLVDPQSEKQAPGLNATCFGGVVADCVVEERYKNMRSVLAVNPCMVLPRELCSFIFKDEVALYATKPPDY